MEIGGKNAAEKKGRKTYNQENSPPQEKANASQDAKTHCHWRYGGSWRGELINLAKHAEYAKEIILNIWFFRSKRKVSLTLTNQIMLKKLYRDLHWLNKIT